MLKLIVVCLFCMSARFRALHYHEMEDKLETEIDRREPREFRRYETLSARPNGFKYMTTYTPTGSNTFDVGNWELFAAR